MCSLKTSPQIQAQIKPLIFEVDDLFHVNNIDGCEFIYSLLVDKAIISLETDGGWLLNRKIKVIYPDGLLSKPSPDQAAKGDCI
ncbi:hypothetical protein [Niallia nealsonii]|uniref:Uncharacterized protein n=1 Tax=Niallia nealsonii TaxID=115979 RepID=A0A2N0Z022_9BACI|nr:hypothetical protein [Niallia nealsonii]PKG22849.1 hypothetical protein CWS01_14270 [Niallia nealsonii]